MDTAQVTIRVLDVNDHAPTFNASKFTVQVYENSPVPTEVIRLVAEDLDAGNLNGGGLGEDLHGINLNFFLIF